MSTTGHTAILVPEYMITNNSLSVIMKAITSTGYGSPDVLQPIEIDKPAPRDNEIRIRIKATTVAAADHRTRSFTVPSSVWLPARLALGVTKPRKSILGVELAGVVESVGTEVTRFREGDAVFAATLNTFGAYAEYICLPEDGPIAFKPENLSFGEAAALPIGGRTALHFLRMVPVKPGQKVLIYGASGSVGTYAVQIAAHFGAEVTGVCSASNADLVKSLGADNVVDYTGEHFIDQLERYDVVFEVIDKLPFAVSKQVLKEEGVYLNCTDPIPGLNQLWTSLTSSKQIMMSETVPEEAQYLADLKTLVEEGAVRPVIDRSYPMDDIVEAHRYVDQGHKKGNVVITVE